MIEDCTRAVERLTLVDGWRDGKREKNALGTRMETERWYGISALFPFQIS